MLNAQLACLVDKRDERLGDIGDRWRAQQEEPVGALSHREGGRVAEIESHRFDLVAEEFLRAGRIAIGSANANVLRAQRANDLTPNVAAGTGDENNAFVDEHAEV